MFLPAGRTLPGHRDLLLSFPRHQSQRFQVREGGAQFFFDVADRTGRATRSEGGRDSCEAGRLDQEVGQQPMGRGIQEMGLTRGTVVGDVFVVELNPGSIVDRAGTPQNGRIGFGSRHKTELCDVSRQSG